MRIRFWFLALLLSAQLYCSAQTLKSFNNGPLQLFYEEYGHGPALYILSGGPGEAPEHSYRQIVDSLTSYYTCVLIRWDITDKLKKLKIPALIVYGRQDDQGESTFYMQKERLRFSETHVIEKCGHEIGEEQPYELFRILIDYVKRRKA